MNGKNTGKYKNTVYTISSFWAAPAVVFGFTRFLSVLVQSLGRVHLVAAVGNFAPLNFAPVIFSAGNKKLTVRKRLSLWALPVSAILLATGAAQAQTTGSAETDAGTSVMEAAAGDVVDTSNMTVEELEAFVEKQRAELAAAIAERDKHAEQLKEIMTASEDNETSAAEKAEKLQALCEEHGDMFQEKIDADPSFASNPDYQKYTDACDGV